MSLTLHVQLESNGLVGEDDGNCAWQSTTVAFGHGRTGIISDVLVDGYSGAMNARIIRDDFQLPARLVEALAIAIYKVCGRDMRQADCDFGEAIYDVEPMIRRLFYRADAEILRRKFHSVINVGRHGQATFRAAAITP